MHSFSSQVAVAEAANCGLKLQPQLPYSPDLAQSDFSLFPKLKSHMHGHHFGNNEEVIHAVEFLEDQDATTF